MRRGGVVLCRVEDADAGERTTEGARCDLPETDLRVLEAGTGLDTLEELTHQHGQGVLRGGCCSAGTGGGDGCGGGSGAAAPFVPLWSGSGTG